MTNGSVTYLFVPGDHPFDKACISGSDVLILDLEDSVHPLHKSLARQEVGLVTPLSKKGGNAKNSH